MARIEDINLNSPTGDYEDRYGSAFNDFVNFNGPKINFTGEKNNVPRYKGIRKNSNRILDPGTFSASICPICYDH